MQNLFSDITIKSDFQSLLSSLSKLDKTEQAGLDQQ